MAPRYLFAHDERTLDESSEEGSVPFERRGGLGVAMDTTNTRQLGLKLKLDEEGNSKARCLSSEFAAMQALTTGT